MINLYYCDVYALWLLKDNGNVFLLAARRRKKSKTSVFVISEDFEDLKKDSDSCIANVCQ